MSLSVIVGWGIAAAIAVVAFLYARRMDKDLAETELLRAGLRARAEEYRKAGTASAFKDQYFSLAAADTEQTNDEIEGYRRKAKTNDEIEGYRRKAIVGEQEGRALMLVAAALDAVVKQPTKAKMIAVMEHFVLDFGQRTAQTADPEFDDTFLITALNKTLAEIKQHDRGSVAL
jgi:hypothetical protein